MIKLRYAIEWKQPPGMLLRDFRANVVPKALAALGDWWARLRRPEHFKRSAHAEYGYQERTAGYLKRKLRARSKGQVYDAQTRSMVVAPPDIMNDLVYTGRTKREVLGQYQSKVNQRAVEVKMRIPGYLGRGRRGTGPNVAAELVRVSEREQKMMPDVFRGAASLALANPASGSVTQKIE